jgi:hypothetical protein
MARRHCAHGDEGTSTLGYLAVLMLISAIFAAVITSGTPATIAGGIRTAICRILGESGCQGTSPQAVDPYEPRQDCWTSVRDATIEGVATVSIRVLGLRGGRRVTVTTRRVQHPDGSISYDVIISPNVEIGVDGSLPLGGKADISAWAALQMTNGKIYSFNASDYGGDESKTKDAASKFADKLWMDQAQSDALDAWAAPVPFLEPIVHIPAVRNGIKKGLGWLINKTSPITKHLPIIGDNIKRATQAPDRDINKPTQSFIEGGPSVGWSGGVQFGGAFGLNTNGRGFVNVGVRTNYGSDKYYKNIYFKMNGEAEVAPSVDLGSWIPKNTTKDPKAFDDFITVVEHALSAKSGRLITISADVKKALQASWPKVALSVKGKAARMYMLSTDKQGNPTQLRVITESQYVFSVAGMGGKGIRGTTVSAFAQTSVGGRKYNTQSILNLDGPENAENLRQVKQFLNQVGQTPLSSATMGLADFFNLSPNAQAFGDYIKRNGQTYQQIWDSHVTTYVGGADGKLAKGYLLYEPETNTLTDAQYYNPDKGWLPWTVCKVKW